MEKKVKKKKDEPVENAESTGGGKKRKGKKKLLLIPVLLLLVAAIAAAAVLFVLPHFGINLLGGGSEEPSGPVEEKIPKKGIETYAVGEDTAVALDTILEEGEGELLALRSPPGKADDGVESRYTYIYELNGAAAIVDRYLDLMMSGEEPFSLVDESYLILEERPELEDAEGALILARNSVVEGHVFQLVIGWSEASANLAVRVSAPEGALHKPVKVEPPKPASVGEQMATIQSMSPAELALPGSSMSEYDIYPIEGFVKIDGMDCRRFHIYEAGDSYSLAGIIFLSGDQQHVYRMDPDDNTIITELK